jgi:CheY-like chemotaxis protein
MTASRVSGLAGKTILIADDEADLREIIKDELEDEGCIVIEAANGKEAYARSLGHVIDAIISDVRMPGGDGMELLRKIKATNPFSPVVILMTGFTDIPHLHVYQLGAYTVFSKPFRLADLKAALSASLLSEKSPTRRKHPRIPIELEVELKLEDGSGLLQGVTANVGRGGFFVRTDIDPPASGTPLSFKFDKFAGVGISRWAQAASPSGSRGVGVEITSLQADGVESLTYLLENFTGS